jgi:ankyrin repeat protein
MDRAPDPKREEPKMRFCAVRAAPPMPPPTLSLSSARELRVKLRSLLTLSLLLLAGPAAAGGYEDLVAAIRAGDVAQVRAVLASGVPATVLQPEKSAPLVIAVVGKNHEIAKTLLDAGADVNIRHPSYYNATALMLAVNNRDAAMTRLLLDAGADVNLTDKAGDSALNWTTFYGDAEIAELLLARGIDATLFGHGNALDVAMRRGHQALVERYTDYLKRRNPVSAKDAALFTAVAAGDVAAMRAALAAGAKVDALDSTRRSALAAAARRGDLAMTTALLDAGASIDAADPIGFTPLMEAARDGKAEIVALLLDRGADVARRAARNGLELSALHLAAAAGQPDTVKLLVQRGAPIDAVDSELATPLLWATNQQPPIAVLLIELGANPDLAPSEGQSPRKIAEERKMEALLAALKARG